MNNLVFKAGPSALRAVAQDGLCAENVHAIIAASGAAKWLGVCGLDQAIFGEWLAATGDNPIDVLGTSIGTFKLAAAFRADPAHALGDLAEAYIAQQYTSKPTPVEVARETERIVDTVLPDRGRAVLEHPRLRLHAGTVRCQQGLSSELPGLQKRALVAGFCLNALRRGALRRYVSRVVFSDPRSTWPLSASDGLPSEQVSLDAHNIVQAVNASGALPVYMQAVEDIAGSAPGVYRDGGLLDYHPVPDLMFDSCGRSGIILYPHFFDSLCQGWFDKFLPWRRVPGSALDNVLLVAPSAHYVAKLPGGRLPDRADFLKLDNQARQRNWRDALAASAVLGEEFLNCVNDTDALLKRIEPLE